MGKSVMRFLRDRSGATSLEYGLIIALVFLVILTSVTAFADATTGVFNSAMTALTESMGSS